MRQHSPKKRTYRDKVNNEYITIYVNKVDSDIWNLGGIISKSKREANDWYRARRNRRARRAEGHARLRGMKEMMILFRLARTATQSIPYGHSVVALPSSFKNKTMMKYIERLGFSPAQMSEEEFLWVLVDPRNQEDLQQS